MPKLEKNSVHTVTIDSYSSTGQGIARLDGMAVFVRGALRGERCRISLMKVGKTCAWARVLDVLTPSPARIVPDCPYYPTCGGCAMRHMTYEEELECKRQRVNDALQRIGGLELSVDTICGAQQVQRYRNKAAFPVSQDHKTGVKVGFYRERSHEVIDVSSCLLQSDIADKAGRVVRKWMHRYAVPAYEERSGTGLIRHVFVRTNRRRESLICVVANANQLPFERELTRALTAACPKAVGIILNSNTRKTNVILGKTYRVLWGRDFLEDRLCGLTFRLSVPSFFQVNRDQAEMLYNYALEFAGLTGTETVVDLYCGTGTISLVMAKKAK
ncbi:MAG: 23S rRNA (uracil(1939)-C(5))-methyltransferase RlmD, partial [Candidatus Onthomonas sp.]|nr:23S rRNA (uracil(1939)-C(5))-methyltransferase RlmD [Candidatus Onthomonas sp.]